MEQLIIKEEDMDKTISELFNIDPEIYNDVLICSLNINSTILQELKTREKNYLSDLILMSSKELLALREVGNGRLNQLLKFFGELKENRIDIRAYQIAYSRNIPLTLVLNRKMIAKGDFSSVEINKKNDRIISKYKLAQETVGEEIAEICIKSPDRILPVISALSSFHQHQSIISSKRCVLTGLLSRVPEKRKSKLINLYIQLYPANTQSKNILSRIFCHNNVKLTVDEINYIISNDNEYQVVINFLRWFALTPKFYIKSLLKKIVIEPNKKRILNLRTSGYSFSDIAKILNYTEKYVINKNNEIINTYFSDNNSLASFILLSLDLNNKKCFDKTELEEEYDSLVPNLIYLYSNSRNPHIYFDKVKEILVLK